MEFSAVVELFENMAASHIDIQDKDGSHFCKIDIEEVETGLRSKIKSPCIFLECPEGALDGDNIDQAMNDKAIGFMVLKAVKINDFKAQIEALDWSEKVGLDFISWINKMRGMNTLTGFDFHSVKWQKVGPVFDGWYGYRFTFKVSDQEFRIQYNNERWAMPLT